MIEDVGDQEPLAAVVDNQRAEIAIESLRAEGVYDDTRSVRPYTEATVALPITAPPQQTAVRDVIRQRNPEYRTGKLADVLAARGWSESDLEDAPGSWAVIGSVIVVRIPEGCPDKVAVAEALLELHGEAQTVLADEGVSGLERTPVTRHLAGETETETVHTEAGTQYALDPTKVMFSPGNQAERVRMGEVVSPDERVFDMFAGIGYFTLPMARAGARVTATEINPVAFRYLLENAVLNGVSERVDAYLEDCRTIAETLTADRVVMGYYGTSGEGDGNSARKNEADAFLEAALSALSSGGTIHYHEATPEPELWDRPLDRLEAAVEDAGRTFTLLEKRRIKSHSAGVQHIVVDGTVD